MQDHCRWCVGAHNHAFTFSSQDHGRLPDEYISKHSPTRHVETLKITVGCRWCTYPSIHFFVSRSRSVFLALSLPSVCPSFFLFSSPLFSSLFLSSLSCLLSLLSVTMTMITRPSRLSLTCLKARVRGPRSIPCLSGMCALCKKQLSWCDYASLAPLGMK